MLLHVVKPTAPVNFDFYLRAHLKGFLGKMYCCGPPSQNSHNVDSVYLHNEDMYSHKPKGSSTCSPCLCRQAGMQVQNLDIYIWKSFTTFPAGNLPGRLPQGRAPYPPKLLRIFLRYRLPLPRSRSLHDFCSAGGRPPFDT